MTARPTRSPRLRGDRGSATAETAIVLPVVVVMVLVIAVAGVGLGTQVRLEDAARAAARELARGEDAVAARETARRIAGDEITVAVGEDGNWARVEVSTTVHAPGGVLRGARWTLTADAEARREPHLLGTEAPAGSEVTTDHRATARETASTRKTVTARSPATGSSTARATGTAPVTPPEPPARAAVT